MLFLRHTLRSMQFKNSADLTGLWAIIYLRLHVNPLTLTLSVLLLLLAGCGKSERGNLSPADLKFDPASPKGDPGDYYIHATQLFAEGKRDDAVFWFYVGQLRSKFYLKANPNLDPSGAPAAYAALNATIGGKINEYAGGDIKQWVKSIDRALEWDAAMTNAYTSKVKFAAVYETNRAGLKKTRDEIVRQADQIRAQRRKAGLEIRD